MGVKVIVKTDAIRLWNALVYERGIVISLEDIKIDDVLITDDKKKLIIVFNIELSTEEER
ncbi:hypothetical protein J7J18_06150 [bacterium]|nr:hypothetical protein [bacterium]